MEDDTTLTNGDRDLRLLAVAATGIIAIALLIIAAAIVSSRRKEETDAEPDVDTLEPREVATVAIEPQAEPIDQLVEEATARS